MKFPSLIHRIHWQIKSKYHYLSLQSAQRSNTKGELNYSHVKVGALDLHCFRVTNMPLCDGTLCACVQFPSSLSHSLCPKHRGGKIKERICNCKWFNINSSASFCSRIGRAIVSMWTVRALTHIFPFCVLARLRRVLISTLYIFKAESHDQTLVLISDKTYEIKGWCNQQKTIKIWGTYQPKMSCLCFLIDSLKVFLN